MNKMKKFALISLAALTLSSNTFFAAGEVKDGRVSTYLKGALQSVADVEGALKGAGFETVATYPIDGDLTTVVFTSAELKATANKANRGFAAVLRVLVDKKDKQISISNPIYFEKAFLQDEYDATVAEGVLAKLNGAFAGLTDSKDNMKFGKLAGYHFMIAMPYYDDMDTVAKGDNATLIQKATASGKVLFNLQIAEGRNLLGFALTPETSKFVSTIGTKNGFVLPYTVLVEGNKAKALAGKYYIAVTYPSLKMSHFMKISNIPGAIENEAEQLFK